MAEPARRTRRFGPAGPVTGLFFVALAGLFLAEALTAQRLVDVVVIVPLVLIGLGLVGAVRVATRGRRDRDRDLPRR